MKYTDPDGRITAEAVGVGVIILTGAFLFGTYEFMRKNMYKQGVQDFSDAVSYGYESAKQTVSDGISFVKSKIEERSEQKSLVKEKTDNNGTVIYRLGSGNSTNLTPRSGKNDEGLSYTNLKQIGVPYTETTIEAINFSGILDAVQDGKKSFISVSC